MCPNIIHSENTASRIKRIIFDDGRSFIVKFCNKNDCEFSKYQQGFLLEYQYMSPLDHCGIPEYFYLRTINPDGSLCCAAQKEFSLPDSFMPDAAFIVMEDCAPDSSCKTLYSFLSDCDKGTSSPDSRLSNSVIRRIINKLYPILDYLKDHGILYMDLNPDNIIIDRHMNLKLIDFTFCKYIDAEAVPDSQLYYVPKCCGNVTRTYYNHYCSDLNEVKADELLTAVFAEFYSHLFFKNRFDYLKHYRLTDMQDFLMNCGYVNKRLFTNILSHCCPPIDRNYRLEPLPSWLNLLDSYLAKQ